MILTDATGRESEIRALLKKARPRLSETEMDAWMQSACTRASIFCILEDGALQALLVLKYRTLHMGRKKARIAIISEFLCSPQWDAQTAFDLLMEPAMDAASRSALMVLVRTRHPGLLKKRGFSALSTSLQAAVPARLAREASPFCGRQWNRHEDLYPVYRQFMDNFDGSIILTPQEFDERMTSWMTTGRTCLVFEDDQGLPASFALVHQADGVLQADLLCYTSLESLKRMLSHFAALFSHARIEFTRSENLHGQFGLESEECGSVMLWIPDHDLVSRWSGRPCPDAASLFNPLPLPSWNQML